MAASLTCQLLIALHLATIRPEPLEQDPGPFLAVLAPLSPLRLPSLLEQVRSALLGDLRRLLLLLHIFA
jgi:hypothetical protein